MMDDQITAACRISKKHRVFTTSAELRVKCRRSDQHEPSRFGYSPDPTQLPIVSTNVSSSRFSAILVAYFAVPAIDDLASIVTKKPKLHALRESP